jgi:hypothetical protein
MQQDFNVELEDGSISEVSKAMVRLYTECLQGGSPFLEHLRATARSGAAQSQKVGGGGALQLPLQLQLQLQLRRPRRPLA